MILLSCLLSLLIRPSFGSPLASSGSSTCPEGWADGTLVGMGCLLFESNASYTWDNANYFCQDTHNATLVSIESEDQHQFVIMMMGFSTITRTLTFGGRQARTRDGKESGTGHQHSLQLGGSSGPRATNLMDFWQQIVSA